jgi:lysozyme
MSNDDTLIAELRRDEGMVRHAYQDHLGYWTIGIGRLIDKRKGGGIAEHEAAYLLKSDIAKVQLQLDQNLPWWRDLDPVRQRALQNMAFQLGLTGLLKFRNSLAAIKAGEWERAVANLRRSLWVKQTPARAGRVIEMFRTGTV